MLESTQVEHVTPLLAKPHARGHCMWVLESGTRVDTRGLARILRTKDLHVAGGDEALLRRQVLNQLKSAGLPALEELSAFLLLSDDPELQSMG